MFIDRGLVKNVHVVIMGISSCIITIRLLCEFDHDNDGHKILLPHITMSTTLASGYMLNHLQFPLQPAYAMTFNSCQGMTLQHLGIDLTRPVFAHGQLYTALGRVHTRKDITIFYLKVIRLQ